MTDGALELTEAVKSLRLSLGESQQQFSNRLGIALGTVARYETKNPPKGPVLLTLADTARKAQRWDLARVFERAYTSGMAPS